MERVVLGTPKTKLFTKTKSLLRNRESAQKFLALLQQKYNLNTPEDWNSITWQHIQSNGGRSLLNKYSMFEIKCMACPEGNSTFNNPKQAPGYWEIKENIHNFLSKIAQKYNLNTPEDWNSIKKNQIKSSGGSTLLKKYSMFDLKCMACPEGESMFNNPPQASGYWENQENVDQFLAKIKEKYNLNTQDDWNSITQKYIQSSGGSTLLKKYSIFEIKCMGFPEGKSSFTSSPQSQAPKYWENQANIDNFLSKIKEKYNLNTPDDWNSITRKLIQSNGGWGLLSKYSIFEIKCMACPEGKSTFNNPSEYWENQENIDKFLSKLKEKYNLNTPNDWNSIKRKHILSNGGWGLLKKYSLFEIKCMACPEGKLSFNNLSQSSEYWEKKENVDNFFVALQEKYNLNTIDDWNSIKKKHVQSNGGSRLLKKYSLYEIKCMACPEGKSTFNRSQQSSKYWENQENIDNFLSELKAKYNLNTPDDWNSITQKHIQTNGGWQLLSKYSMFEIKCMACPEGKSTFTNPPGYWENQANIDNFLSKIKRKYNLNTPEDWNSITQKHIQSNGGRGLLSNHSMLELKCMACPEGKSTFTNPPIYWENQENIDNFLSKIKEKYNLKTPKDWKRLSKNQIIQEGGSGLLTSKMYSKIKN